MLRDVKIRTGIKHPRVLLEFLVFCIHDVVTFRRPPHSNSESTSVVYEYNVMKVFYIREIYRKIFQLLWNQQKAPFLKETIRKLKRHFLFILL